MMKGLLTSDLLTSDFCLSMAKLERPPPCGLWAWHRKGARKAHAGCVRSARGDAGAPTGRVLRPRRSNPIANGSSMLYSAPAIVV